MHWVELSADEIHADQVTNVRSTLRQCLRGLPFDEALAIADSALRHRAIDPAGLHALADQLRGPGAAQARRVANCADGRSTNAFESVLRASALDVKGLHFLPQQVITSGRDRVQPDLVDKALRVVAEADSFTWHGKRSAFRRDCLERAVRLRARRAQRRRTARRAA